MATLPTTGVGTYTNGSATAITGTDPVLEPIASADDADYVYDRTNTTHTGLAWFAIDSLPSDFFKMLTLSVNLRYHWDNVTPVNTWTNITAQIYQADQSTAMSNEVTIASSITTTTPTNSGATALTGLDTSSGKAVWEGAYLAIRWNISKNKGGDTIEKRVTAAELTGTYDINTAKIYFIF